MHDNFKEYILYMLNCQSVAALFYLILCYNSFSFYCMQIYLIHHSYNVNGYACNA